MPGDASPPDDDPSGWLRVGPSCSVRLDELRWRFTTSGGPGGQHANRASTRVEVRLDIAGSPSLTDAQRARLTAALGPQVAVTVDETRSQSRNRALALDALRSRLLAALAPPRPPRRPTRPSRGAVERRLDAKRRRGQTKARRRSPRRPED